MAKHVRDVNFSSGIIVGLNAYDFVGRFFFDNIVDGHKKNAYHEKCNGQRDCTV